jgi:hypothetical protein
MKRYISEAEPDFETSCFIKKTDSGQSPKEEDRVIESHTIFRAV